MAAQTRDSPLEDPPPYSCGGVIFRCYRRGDGGYVWRSACGRIACGTWDGRYVVKFDGRLIGREPTLRQAMRLGVLRISQGQR